jgi:hypothetical protein
MKKTELHFLIKEAVKEAIHEELKEIILEAIKSPKSPIYENTHKPIMESKDTYAQPYVENPKTLSSKERREIFSGLLGEMQNGGIATSAYAGELTNVKNVDTINGALPEGQVSLESIMSLMNK